MKMMLRRSVVPFVQPFISYTYPNSTTVALNTETTYDWNAEEATVPVN